MNLRHGTAMSTADLDDTADLDAGDDSILDDERLGEELAELVEFTAAFLAWAEGPLLRSDFARFAYGAYTLGELRADLCRLGAWIRANA